ncbi:chemotaxis regulatin CheY-phosphate phosphatase CheZ [Streptomyces ambofaciens]
MPDSTNPVPVLSRIASDASCLHQALRALPAEQDASTLAARITDAQDLADTVLRLFQPRTPPPN